jgi:acyl-CoA thioesterase
VHRLNVGDFRGLMHGSLYDTSGTLIAATTQRSLWRV